LADRYGRLFPRGDDGAELVAARAGHLQADERRPTMNLDQIEKKLREGEYFLGKMRERESRAFGDREPFDFCLSAFLSAARTVDYRLRHEQAATYPSWRTAWDARLPPNERTLIKFLVDDRNIEVHESGSGRSMKTAEIPLSGNTTYSDESGTLTVLAPPRALTGNVGPDAVIMKPSYHFTIDGAERKATDACAEYLSLLTRMVQELKAEQAAKAQAQGVNQPPS
jgi:hypothetical protein